MSAVPRPPGNAITKSHERLIFKTLLDLKCGGGINFPSAFYRTNTIQNTCFFLPPRTRIGFGFPAGASGGWLNYAKTTIKNQIFKFRETQWVSMAQTWMKLAEAAERLQPHQGAKGRGW